MLIGSKARAARRRREMEEATSPKEYQLPKAIMRPSHRSIVVTMLLAVSALGIAAGAWFAFRSPELDIALTGTQRRPIVVVGGKVEQMPAGDYLAANTLVDTTGCSSTNVIAWNGSQFACAAAGGGGSGGGITNSAGANVIMKSDGTNAVASRITDPTSGVAIAGQGSNAYALTVNGPMTEVLTASDTEGPRGEVFTQFITGGTHTGTADVCGVVVRNQLAFDTTSGANQACAGYFESSASRSAGTNTFTNYGVRGYAANAPNGNYALFCEAGTLRCDAGASLGPVVMVGSLAQSAGNVTLNTTSGTTTINGATQINSSLIVNTTIESGTNTTVDGNLRVNGSSNLAGGAGVVFLQSINSSGIPIPTSNSIAFTTARYSASTAADPTLGLIIVTGTGTNLTLADGTKDGQIWHLSIKSGTGQVTPAHLNGGTKYTWSAVGQSLILAWDATAGSWVQVSNSGMTLV